MLQKNKTASLLVLLFCIVWLPLGWLLALPPLGYWPCGLLLHVPCLLAGRKYQLPIGLCSVAGGISGLLAALLVAGSFIFNPVENDRAKLFITAFFILFFFVQFFVVAITVRLRWPLARLFLLPGCILAGEYFISRSMVIVPIYHGLLLVDTPLAAFLASRIGFLAPSLFVLVVNILVFKILTCGVRPALAALLGLMVLPILPWPTMSYTRMQPRHLSYVQQAIPQSVIRAAGHFSPLYWDIAEQYLASLEDLADSVDIAVLPENAFLLHYPEHAVFFDRLRSLASAKGMAIIGPARLGGVSKQRYNALLHVSPEGNVVGSYKKINLFPGVETGAFTAGAGSTVFSAAITIGPMICYDSVFPSMYRHYREQDVELIVVAAEAGFIRNPTVPWVHLKLAQLYAMTYGLPVLHVSQSGPSALLMPDGSISGLVQFGEQRTVVLEF